MDVTMAAHVFAALFAIMNPIAGLGVFLSLTAGMDAGAQRRVAATAVIATAIGCALSVLAGNAVLGFFGVSDAAFRAAGGALVFLIGLGMIRGEGNAAHHGSEREQPAMTAPQENPGVFPLAVPMLVGPGVITTLVVFAGRAGTEAETAGIWAGLAAVLAVLAGVLLAGPALGRRLGATAESIMSRLMGMILAAIGMEMLAEGLGAQSGQQRAAGAAT